ncbi:nickel/cobalt transporter [Kushneria aurantia]|uniref:Nickel/cobalt efflux system n=1 Tax=Kushneria aurantia TaxID=504092 RepID=A0ABV6G004_9GAMM|nr:hypothetical protein [Kushneria aurantia]
MSRPLIVAALIAVMALAVLLAIAPLTTLWGSFTVMVFDYQRSLHRGLAEAMMALSRRDAISDWLDLIALSFGYGVFHALGPGHGKAVIASWLLARRAALTRGIAMTLAAALLQGAVAIALVTVLVLGLGLVTREAMTSTLWAERASFVAVVGLGLWLVWRSLRRLQHATARQPPAATPIFSMVTTASAVALPLAPQRAPSTLESAAVCASCGRAHHVEPESTRGSAIEALGAVLAIGLRPCSGAVMVLGVAALLGFWWAGVLAVAAMSLGTALSTSLLALLTVLVRSRMTRLGHRTPPRWQLLTGQGAALCAGLFIAALGITLLLNTHSADISPLMVRPSAF